MRFVGEGASDNVVQRFKEGIENIWSGKYDDGTTVHMKVALVTRGDYIEINVVHGSSNAAMHGLGAYTGTWGADATGWDAAHEMGHIFGLMDKYAWGDASRVMPGYEDRIMGARGGMPNYMDIQQVIEFIPMRFR